MEHNRRKFMKAAFEILLWDVLMDIMQPSSPMGKQEVLIPVTAGGKTYTIGSSSTNMLNNNNTKGIIPRVS
jgi:hypothetical protein